MKLMIFVKGGQSNWPPQDLRVFLDEQGLIRVGGRLRHAALPSDYKHPIVISRLSSLARPLVTDARATLRCLCASAPRPSTWKWSRI